MRAPVTDQMATHRFTAEAAKIVRSCVHCGFCNATCPTYQLTGDELEGPRGRIYLMRSLLDGGEVGEDTRRHLDQCLQCRNCETTCPSGVRYGTLLELMRPYVAENSTLPWMARLKRAALLGVVPHRARFRALLAAGRLVRPLLPQALAQLIPASRAPLAAVSVSHARRVLLLGGCAQPALNPNIDAAAALIFERVGISLVTVPAAGCCGALAMHLGAERDAVNQAKANLDAWWPEIENGAEAVMASSSGCGVHLKEYARILSAEPGYRERAERMQSLVRDPIELLDATALKEHVRIKSNESLAVQTPCTLQHGQRLGGRVEQLLRELGCVLAEVREPHLCCGSAGSYSVLHGGTARQLRERKLANLMRGRPTKIVTANIGCQSHLGATAAVPVPHWLEFLAENLLTD